MKETPSPHIIQLFEWFEDPETISLVMEYPEHCETLQWFFELNSGHLEENVVWTLMVQIVQSAKECIDHRVYHGDIYIQKTFWSIQHP